MQLTAADRRSVIENILDINVFTNMNTLLKGKILQSKENLRELSNKIENQKQKIDYQKIIINKTVGLSEDEIEELNNTIQSNQSTIDTLNSTISEYHNNKIKIDEQDLITLEKDLVKFQRFTAQISLKMANAIEEKQFYEKEENCSKCKGKITEETKKTNLEEIEKNIKQFEEANKTFESQIETITSSISSIKEKLKANNNIDDKIKDLKNQIAIINMTIEHAKSKLKKTETNQTDIVKEKDKLNEYNIQLKIFEEEKESKKEEYIQLEQISDILKDSGVKAKIIKHYLPSMNKNINKYLKSMDFFVQFYLDENFQEVIKSRNRDEFSYMNFSEGEKMRIDLSLLLAWREIAKLKNSVNCNLLILDEVFDSSLDSVGTDEVMKLLNTLGVNSNVFVISHKADQIVDKFNHVIHFEKKNNFSKMI
jgi:DNA repair exonuclease SbcCD ATPase subunit